MIGLNDLALVMCIFASVLWLRGWAFESLACSTSAVAAMMVHRQRQRAAAEDDDEW